jgi:hypothetical protein
VAELATMNLLRHGGDFTLTVNERFPPGTELEPAEYEYYFRVLTSD